MVDCMRHAQKHVCDLISLAELPLAPETAGSVNCPGDWVLLPLLATQDARVIHHWAGMEPEQLHYTDGGWAVYLWENPSEETWQETTAERQRGKDMLPDLSYLGVPYSHSRACLLPSKVTATQLKGRELDEEIAQGTVAVRRRISITKPRFLQDEQSLSAAEKGTAMHLVMQYLPFNTPAEPEAVKNAVEELLRRRLITQQQMAVLRFDELQRFLSSPLIDRIRNGSNLQREYRFALLVSASIYDPAVADDEKMMLQGVVDCCFEEKSELVIVDFKTDRIRPGEEKQRAEVYRPQLEAYGHALEQVMGKPVKEKILYFFATNIEITL